MRYLDFYRIFIIIATIITNGLILVITSVFTLVKISNQPTGKRSLLRVTTKSLLSSSTTKRYTVSSFLFCNSNSIIIQSVLEAISKKLILINSMKLKDAVGLDCYHKRDEAILSGTKAGDCLYSAGNRNFLYINSNGRNVFRFFCYTD